MSQLEEIFVKIKSHNLVETRSFLEANSSLVHEVNNDDWGIIHCCAAYGTPTILRMLVNEFNADINQFAEGHYTPALLAAKKNNLACLNELITLGADTSITNTSNQGIISFLTSHDSTLDALIGENNADLSSDEEDNVINVVGENFTYKIEIV